jgi:hypothetical protein
VKNSSPELNVSFHGAIALIPVIRLERGHYSFTGYSARDSRRYSPAIVAVSEKDKDHEADGPNRRTFV